MCISKFDYKFLLMLILAFRYLGSSWASGIVTLSGKPYPNGRNQESSSEAIAAYEAIGLYGLSCSKLFHSTSKFPICYVMQCDIIIINECDTNNTI